MRNAWCRIRKSSYVEAFQFHKNMNMDLVDLGKEEHWYVHENGSLIIVDEIGGGISAREGDWVVRRIDGGVPQKVFIITKEDFRRWWELEKIYG